MAAQRGDERRDNYAPVGPFGHFGSAAFSFACNAGNVPDANKWTRDACNVRVRGLAAYGARSMSTPIPFFADRLSPGQRVTLLKIDDMMAMSHRYELEIRAVLEPTATKDYHPRTRLATVRQRGKRKDHYLDLADDDILLDGWNVPFKMDTECGGVFSGNACYNVVGDPEAIRAYVETRAAWPVTDTAKAKILVNREARTIGNDSGTQLLYPEIETHHAVVNRMKDAVGL
jgi:hypothetical protein